MDSSNLNFGDYLNYPGYGSIDYTQLVQTYYNDLTYLADILAKLTGIYNVLISSADGLNRIALAKKKDIKNALKRVDQLGEMIDRIIDLLDEQTVIYETYSRQKSEYIINNLPFNDIIRSYIEHHIRHEHHEHNESK